MAFLSIPIKFIEVDELTDKQEEYDDIIVVNTNAICSYNSTRDGKSTIVRLVDGNVITVNMDIDDFGDVLESIAQESLYDLTIQISEN